MSSAVADLEAGLQAMLSLKPPGVSGSRIQSITTLCTANIQSESVLIQKLYTHFKKTPGTHKLGVLYVVDSVTRKWTEQAKSAGQTINIAAEDGTFAAGVHRVMELLPVLMNDIIQSAPDDQKEKIRKLVDIWEKGQTFPLQMLTSFKERLNATSQNQSTTPPGSPPPNILQRTLGLPQPNAPVQASSAPDTSSILAALANMARQNTAAGPTNSNTHNQNSSLNVPNGRGNPQQAPALNQQNIPIPQIPPPVNVPAPAAIFAPQAQGLNHAVQNFPSNPIQFAGVPPIVPPTALDPAIQKQIMAIKALSDQGVPADKIPGLLTALGIQGPTALSGGGFPPPIPQFPVQNQNQNAQNGQNGWATRQEESRDHERNGHENVRSPERYRRRSRSRSPPRGWNARDSSPNRRRDGPKFDHERGSPGRNHGGDDRGRFSRARGNDYRQRSPPRRRSPTPPRHGGGDKWVGHDNSIGKGNIKVLSRTLFVGGVTCSEQELRNTFDRYGKVQTCIVNKDKRHAFVKMCSRKDAVSAKEAMEKNRLPDSALRTRWGVGFGPRDCSDYQTGVSIIPISKLTDADRKWMLTAEYGGSGGKPIEPGMVVEEPDIEIGQGVSSKAISRRMQTDKGGNNGPKSGRDHEEDDQPRRFRRGSDEERRDRRRDDDRSDGFTAKSGPPAMHPIPPFAMPGFPFQMHSLPNGMPIPPPGFPGFLAQAQTQQPPPPGHRT